MAHSFSFQSNWRLPADLVTVWNQIAQVTQYPVWWPGITEVELLQGPELPVTLGTTARYTVRPPLYTLRYETQVIDFSLGNSILATSTGDLVGSGRWTFFERTAHVEAQFDWQVQLTPPLLEFFSRLPFAKGVMGYFHHRVMTAGERGLQQLLAQANRPAA